MFNHFIDERGDVLSKDSTKIIYFFMIVLTKYEIFK